MDKHVNHKGFTTLGAKEDPGILLRLFARIVQSFDCDVQEFLEEGVR